MRNSWFLAQCLGLTPRLGKVRYHRSVLMKVDNPRLVVDREPRPLYLALQADVAVTPNTIAGRCLGSIHGPGGHSRAGAPATAARVSW